MSVFSTMTVNDLKSKCRLLLKGNGSKYQVSFLRKGKGFFKVMIPKLQASRFHYSKGLSAIWENQALCILKKKVLKLTTEYFYIYVLCIQSLFVP